MDEAGDYEIKTLLQLISDMQQLQLIWKKRMKFVINNMKNVEKCQAVWQEGEMNVYDFMREKGRRCEVLRWEKRKLREWKLKKIIMKT